MKVGIVLAVYKPDPELLSTQLKSIVMQTHSNWHLVVSDDCSVDIEWLKKQVHQVIPQESATVIQSVERRGVVANFGAGLGAVPEDCEFVAFCDQDDEWVSSKLETLLLYFRDSKVMAVHSDLSMVDAAGKEIAPSVWQNEQRDVNQLNPNKVIMRNPVTGCAMMFRRSLAPNILPMPQQPVHPPLFFHDAWVALIALDSGQIAGCPKALVKYRQHGGNVVGVEKKGRSPLSWQLVRRKTLKALATRQSLEKAWLSRSQGSTPRLFTRGFDLGLPILFRACIWSLVYSRGYLRIGLQLAAGKLLWDLGLRDDSKI